MLLRHSLIEAGVIRQGAALWLLTCGLQFKNLYSGPGQTPRKGKHLHGAPNRPRRGWRWLYFNSVTSLVTFVRLKNGIVKLFLEFAPLPNGIYRMMPCIDNRFLNAYSKI